MIYARSNEWTWATPDPVTGGCPPGFSYSSWGCSRRTSLGQATSTPAAVTPSRGPAVMLGVAGLLLSAGIMIAMGFHKPAAPRRRRR